MEVKHRILEFNNSPKYEQLQNELDKLGVEYKKQKFGSLAGREHRSIEYEIGENDPLYPRVSHLIKKYGFYSQVGMYYSQQEIEVAEWVYATVGEHQYPQPEDDLGYRDITYETSDYCPRCGIGAIQDRPFRLKHDFKQKGLRFLGLHWVHDEVFVRPSIKAIFEDEKINGVNFIHPVHHRTDAIIENTYQMTIQTIAEPGLVVDGLSTVTCRVDNEESYIEGVGKFKNHFGETPYCGRVKYQSPRRDTLKFRKDILSRLPDIAKSHEYFGSGAAAVRLILMRNSVVKLINIHKLRGVKFIPLELV